MLPQRATIYAASTRQDLDGGYVPEYALLASGVPCSAQLQKPDSAFQQERLGESNAWILYFGRDPGIHVRDRIEFREISGKARTVYALSEADAAGRGSTWFVPAEERL